MTAPDDVVDVSPAYPTRRGGRTTAIVAVLAVLLVLGGVVTWVATRGGSSGAASGATACPATAPKIHENTSDTSLVPSAPTASGTDGRLVPDRSPDAVLLCEYQDLAGVVVAPLGGEPSTTTSTARTADVPLGRSADLPGDDARVAPLLTALRGATIETGRYRFCELPSPGASPTHVVALRYDDGVVWLATPGYCAGTTNGVADAQVDIAPDVATALDGAAGVATDPPVTMSAAPPDLPSSVPGSSGDAGVPGVDVTAGDLPAGDLPAPDPFVECTATEPSVDAAVLLSITPVTVRVCHAVLDPSVASPVVTDQDAAVAVPLAGALLALPSMSPDAVCPAIGGEGWRLLFTAADGAQAQVDVDAGGCGTATNGLVVAQLDDAMVARLTALG